MTLRGHLDSDFIFLDLETGLTFPEEPSCTDCNLVLMIREIAVKLAGIEKNLAVLKEYDEPRKLAGRRR
jgi:hypothetical protein